MNIGTPNFKNGVSGNKNFVSAVKDKSRSKREENELHLLRNENQSLKLALERSNDEMLYKEQKWKQERKGLGLKIARLENGKKRWKVQHIGRNKMRKKDYDGYDYQNAGVIAIYLTGTLMPHNKFWGKRWPVWTPDKRNTLCGKIVTMIDMPSDEDNEVYWNKHVVGLLNAKRIEWSSYVVSRLFRVFKGAWTFLLLLDYANVLKFAMLYLKKFMFV